jgi:hypothetical protein
LRRFFFLHTASAFASFCARVSALTGGFGGKLPCPALDSDALGTATAEAEAGLHESTLSHGVTVFATPAGQGDALEHT